MIKKILLTFMITACSFANAYVICGPAVRGLDMTYGKLSSANKIVRTVWAVGNNCVGETDTPDVNTYCATPIVIGEAGCSLSAWGTDSEIEQSFEYRGRWCYCRRTHVRINGELVEQLGQWVLVGATTTNNSCFDFCPHACAENVINNRDNMRNNIILLPRRI